MAYEPPWETVAERNKEIVYFRKIFKPAKSAPYLCIYVHIPYFHDSKLTSEWSAIVQPVVALACSAIPTKLGDQWFEITSTIHYHTMNF